MPWLLVLDNADDPDIDYAKYFPDGEEGHIIVTSRLEACRAHATVGWHEFRQMNELDSQTLLLRAAGVGEAVTDQHRESAAIIARKLGYLPLALSQAGASIRQGVCGLQEYIELYDTHKAEMLQDHLVQDTDQYNHTVLTTWEVSVRRIQKAKTVVAADAMDILHTMAFLHFERIPLELLLQAWANNRKTLSTNQKANLSPGKAVTIARSTIEFLSEKAKAAVGHDLRKGSNTLPSILMTEAVDWDTFRFRRALSVLQGHSLVYKDTDQESYSMHPMVHLWSRQRLSGEEQRIWSDYSINILAASLTNSVNRSNRHYRRLLTPHIDACLLQQHHLAAFVQYQDRYTLAKGVKFYNVYAENAEWRKAQSIQRRVIQAREHYLGITHAETLDAMADLADGCWNLFNIGEALLLYQRMAKFSSKAYGAQDRRALKVIDNMAKTLWLAGQTNEALRWSRKATQAMNCYLGEGHPDTLTAVFNLSRNLIHQGYPEQGAEKLEFVLTQRRSMLGDSHPDTISAFAELGVAYRHLRRLDEAEQLLHRVVHERSRILGAQHAYTLWAINDLAKIYTDQGRPQQAERLLLDIIDIVAKTLGSEHIGMLMTKHNLARAYNGQGNWPMGRKTLHEILAIQKRKLPPKHPDIFSAQLELLRTSKQMGEIGEAESGLKKMIDDMDQAGLVEKHPLRRRAMGQLSAIYIDLGKLHDAEELDRRLREEKGDAKETKHHDGKKKSSPKEGNDGNVERERKGILKRALRSRHASTW